MVDEVGCGDGPEPTRLLRGPAALCLPPSRLARADGRPEAPGDVDGEDRAGHEVDGAEDQE